MLISGELGEIFQRIIKKYPSTPMTMPADLLGRDLGHEDYAMVFLEEKFDSRTIKPCYAMNDFVLFRIAYLWPKGLPDWLLDSESMFQADYSLTAEQASDLVEFWHEGLTDGYIPVDYYLRLAILWFAEMKREFHPALLDAITSMLFVPKNASRGRKRSTGIDRDLIIRNLVDGLMLRGLPKHGGPKSAIEVAADTFSRFQGGSITPDAIRKVIERTPRTEREMRLWAAISEHLSDS